MNLLIAARGHIFLIDYKAFSKILRPKIWARPHYFRILQWLGRFREGICASEGQKVGVAETLQLVTTSVYLSLVLPNEGSVRER